MLSPRPRSVLGFNMWWGTFWEPVVCSLWRSKSSGEREPEDQPRTCCSTLTNSGVPGLLNEEAALYLWCWTKESVRHPVATLPPSCPRVLLLPVGVHPLDPIPSAAWPGCCPVSFLSLGLPLRTDRSRKLLPKPAGTSPCCRCSVVLLFTSLATCFSSSASPEVGSLIPFWTNYSYFYLSMLIPERLINCLVAWKQLLPGTHSHVKPMWFLKVVTTDSVWGHWVQGTASFLLLK